MRSLPKTTQALYDWCKEWAGTHPEHGDKWRLTVACRARAEQGIGGTTLGTLRGYLQRLVELRAEEVGMERIVEEMKDWVDPIEAGLTFKFKSERLGRVVTVGAKEAGKDAFTWPECIKLIEGDPTDEELRQILKVRNTFDGEITEVEKKKPERVVQERLPYRDD